MKYMLLIHADESGFGKNPAAEQKMMQDFGKYTEDLQKSGKLQAAGRLKPSTDTTTVRNSNGKQTVMDGPFAETKEQFGGYYVIEAKDLNEALGWAKRIPAAGPGPAVEVRPLWDM